MGTYPKEVFRKTLHIMGVAGVIAWFYTLNDWKESVAITLALAVIIYPVIFICSKIPGFTEFFNARKKGEYSKSMVALFLAYAVVATVCWGYFGQRILGAVCFLAWGPGDAAAALIGKKFGRHKVGRRGVKSVEGYIAMFTFSFISVMIGLYISRLYSVPLLVLIAFLTALVTATVELNVLNGYDTFYCPVSAMIVLGIFQLIL